jgi:hypothetical protein
VTLDRVILPPTVSWPVCSGAMPQSWALDQFFFLFFLEIIFRQLRVCYYGASSLTRGRVSSLQLLLVLTSTVSVRSFFRGTHGQILLSQIWNFPNLECQVPIFISRKNRGLSCPINLPDRRHHLPLFCHLNYTDNAVPFLSYFCTCECCSFCLAMAVFTELFPATAGCIVTY